MQSVYTVHIKFLGYLSYYKISDDICLKLDSFSSKIILSESDVDIILNNIIVTKIPTPTPDDHYIYTVKLNGLGYLGYHGANLKLMKNVLYLSYLEIEDIKKSIVISPYNSDTFTMKQLLNW